MQAYTYLQHYKARYRPKHY